MSTPAAEEQPLPGSASYPSSPGWVAFFRRHPILLLLLLTPGIPEYLSGSSPISAVILNPPQFLFQVAANLGLYGPGVLLIREARVRWHKGWATVLLLGAAYGILEEGVALSTLFDPRSQNAGVLATYGHWLGVSWVWASAVILVHMIYSISIPILLVGLLFPEMRDKSLLSNRRVAVAFAVLAVDVVSLVLVVFYGLHYWMGLPILVGSLATIGGLVYLAHRAPASWPRRRPGPLPRVKLAFVAGLITYPVLLILEGVTGHYGDPLVTLLAVLAWECASLWWVTRHLSFPDNERHLLAFVLGLLAVLFLFGLIANFPLDLAIFEDVALLLFFRYLFRLYPPVNSKVSSPSPQQSETTPSLREPSGPLH